PPLMNAGLRGKPAEAARAMRLAQGIPDERPRFRRWGMRERAQWHRKPLNAGCKMPVTMLASDDGPIFSTVAKLVEALEHFHSRRNAKRGAKTGSPPPRA